MTSSENDDLEFVTATTLEAQLANAESRQSRKESPLATEEAKELSEFLRGVGHSDAQIVLYRLDPQFYNNVRTSGLIDTLDEIPEQIFEQYVQERHGGGKYEIHAWTRDSKGKRRTAGKRKFVIAGNPKIEEPRMEKPATVMSSASEATALGAMDLVRDMVREKQNAGSGFDASTFEVMAAPLKTQIETLNAQLIHKDTLLMEKDRIISEKDRQLNDLANRKPESSASDSLVARMLERGDANVSTLQIAFASEKQQLLSAYNEEKKRMEDRFDRDKQSDRDMMRREMDNLKAMYEMQVRSVEQSWQSRLEAREARIQDLMRENTRTAQELDELRRRKDKSLIETISEARSITEALGELGGGQEKDEGGGIMDMIGPALQAVTQRIAAPQPPPQPQLPPQRRVRRAPPQEAAPAPAPAEKIPAERIGVTEEEIGIAVNAMEEALRGGVAPDAFVSQVRGFVSPQVIVAIKNEGIDKILDHVAVLSADSPLQSQAGRRFARMAATMLSS